MQSNILKQSDVTTIQFQYVENGLRKRYKVRLRFMDTKECFFSTSMPGNFQKPKKKTPVEIKVFTPDGVYKTQVSIIDSTVSLGDVLFNVTIPANWSFIQMRQSTRKNVMLPMNIKFNDGYEINTETNDISMGGVSYLTREKMSSIYEKLNCIITIKMPDDLIINFPDKKLVAEAKFMRSKEHAGEYGSDGNNVVAFRFITLSAEQKEILKMFIMGLD